jgi:hypothetical protein
MIPFDKSIKIEKTFSLLGVIPNFRLTNRFRMRQSRKKAFGCSTKITSARSKLGLTQR